MRAVNCVAGILAKSSKLLELGQNGLLDAEHSYKVVLTVELVSPSRTAAVGCAYDCQTGEGSVEMGPDQIEADFKRGMRIPGCACAQS